MTAAYDRKLEVCRYLTQIVADINILNAKNDTALHFAAASVIVDIIRLLLDIGMPINLNDKHNTTLLHVSVSCGSLEATTIFFDGGADLTTLI
jgi:ankyrin repeat protein